MTREDLERFATALPADVRSVSFGASVEASALLAAEGGEVRRYSESVTDGVVSWVERIELVVGAVVFTAWSRARQYRNAR